MAKKMYYTEAEAAEILGVDPQELAKLVRDDKLRVFQDGGRKMFKVTEVDAIAGPRAEEVKLSPADEGDAISLSDTSEQAPTKEDTVITAEGISIFDDDELEIEAADPMAKTQLAPSLDEQVSTEGVGSGSGLLDLTRESDDTSLGAEVLDHIGEDGGIGSGLEGGEVGSAVTPEPGQVAAASAAPEPTFVEAMDASTGLFNGMTVGGAAVAILLGIITLGAMQEQTPKFLLTLKDNASLVALGAAVVIILMAVVGMVIGKSVATQQEAFRKMGG